MAYVNSPPYPTLKDEFFDVDLETWMSDMTNSNNEIEDAYISLSTLQEVVAASTDFDDFKTRIAALN